MRTQAVPPYPNSFPRRKTRNVTISGMSPGRIDTARQRQVAKLEGPSDADNDKPMCFNGLTFGTEARQVIFTLSRLLAPLTRILSPFAIRGWPNFALPGVPAIRATG